MPQDPANTRVLILHDDATHYYDELQKQFPRVTFRLCTCGSDVAAAVETVKPQIVFSWKGKALPGENQHAALTAPSVEWIQIGGTGFDHLGNLDDVRAVVTNVAGVLSPYMAETVIGAVLAMNYQLPTYIKQQSEGRWQKHLWKPLAEQTILIVGMGTIGRTVALRAKQLGMRVLGLRRTLQPDPSVDEMQTIDHLHAFLPQADFVCLHLPLTSESYRLMGAPEFALMKQSAILINTARGAVVDEAALVAALTNGQIAAAFSDVFVNEPLPPDSPLWEVENLVISPHVSDAVLGWEAMYADFFAQNLNRWLAGEALQNIVDLRQGY